MVLFLFSFVFSNELNSKMCYSWSEFDKGWINSEQLSNLAQKYMKTDYGKYLKDVAGHFEK